MRTLKIIKFTFILLILSIQTIKAQNISGYVIDEEKKPLEFVSVALLQPKDSLLVKYTSTDIHGEFEISDIKSGKYLFQVYLMTYEAQQKVITIENKHLKLDTIQLNREVNNLDEIVISAVIPIKIKQDTISFNTKAFKVRQDDNVGELIKKMPGIEIEANGTVIAQGEEITKILVDGKEFFSNDPTIALQNLSADAIESIEIIDENSEDSRVSGVKDGEQSKIINLVLKPGKKFGYFGKAGAGYGTNNRYAINLDLNSFTKKTQFAVFGKLNNINNTGASIFDSDGAKSATDNGFLTTGTAGANFNYEFKPDYNFNIDYYYGYTDNKQASRSNRTEFTNKGTFDSKLTNASKEISNNHNVNFSLRDRSKKDAYLLLRGKFKSNNRITDAANKTLYLNNDGSEDTSSDRIVNSKDNGNNGELKFSYRKKLGKNGRNIRANSDISYNNSYNQDYQQSVNEYNLSKPEDYRKSNEIITRDNKNNAINYGWSVRYTEPIVKNHYLNFTSEINNEIRELDLVQIKIVNDEEKAGFDHLQDYKKDQYENTIGYLFSKDKFQLSLSGTYDIKKQNLDIDNIAVLTKDYTNILPKASLSYEIKKGKKLRFFYNKNIIIANVSQLSPIINDFNPLRISFGNPSLTPSEAHNINARYFSHNLKNANSFFIYLKYNKTNNAIVSNRYFGENRVRYSTYENYGSRSDLSGNMNFSKKISKLNMRYAVRINGDINDRTTIISDEYNVTKAKAAGGGISFSNINKNVVDVTVGGKIKYTNTTYSLQDTENNNLEQNYYTKFDYDISKSINFNSQFNYTLYSDSNFDSQAVPIWNAAVEYVFMKGKRGNLKLQVFDILNKDVGVFIRSTPDYYEETFRKNLGTYAMLSFNYSLKPTTKKPAKDESDKHYRL
ncbi:hypothetical protein EC396_13930 [Lutibacter sp. HS1-25]|uniref:TonB-dependent receptor n=1 Tax=Lutibacter sp. HS1-25 TaxID=2485000 RepID=UPI001013A14B|nr:TonB-dependent receptor [Lutibacter sp. HS1-25]RXP46491.1 hypothetical protein EC396_13930 [Lutibacter sp. HS1-25]